MIKAKVTTKDHMAQLKESLDKIMKLDVLVGIPAEKSSRSGEPINNAELLFVQSHGSPMRHIPARPVIEPAIEAEGNKELITVEMGQAITAVLELKPDAARLHLERAGQQGENASRSWFTDPRNNWQPNALPTVREKLAKKYKSQIGQTKAMARYLAGESDMITVLVDSGQMRQAITHVVRNGND